MIIPINERYRINSDKQQWIVQSYKGINKNTQQGEWRNDLFYTSLSSLLAGLHERMLRESSAIGLADAMEESKSISCQLLAALSPDYKSAIPSKYKLEVVK